MDNDQTHGLSDRFRRGDLPSRREVLRILFRHKRKIIGFFLSAVLVTGAVTLNVVPTYESRAALLIRVGRESVSMDPSVPLGPTLGVSQDRANEINSEIGILTSPYLIEKVIERIGLAVYLDVEEPRDELYEGAVAHFLGNLSATSTGDDSIIVLTFQARSPELAQHSLATLIRHYLDRHIEIHKTQASPAFFQERSSELLQKLTTAEDVLERFRDENQIAAVDVQKGALISQISGLETALNNIIGAVDSSEARLASLQSSLNSRPNTSELSRVSGLTNPAADQIKSRLIDLRFQETDLAARYPDDERALRDVRKQIKVALALAELEAEQETRSQVTTGIDRNFEVLQLELMTERSQLYASMARLRSLTQELAVRRAELTELAAKEIELVRLGRAVDIADQEYRDYVVHYQRAEISAALDSDKVSNVGVVQPASFSSFPVGSGPFLNVVLGLFIGLFGGVGIAFLAELLDDSLKSNEDVARRLGLPVLATLSAEEYQSCT